MSEQIVRLVIRMVVYKALAAHQRYQKSEEGGIDFGVLGEPGLLEERIHTLVEGIAAGVVTSIQAKIPMDETYLECLTVASFECWRSKHARMKVFPVSHYASLSPEHRALHRFLADETFAAVKKLLRVE